MRKHFSVETRLPRLHYLAPLFAPFVPGLHLPMVALYAAYRALRAGRPDLGIDIALVLALTHLGYGAGEWVGLLSPDSDGPR